MGGGHGGSGTNGRAASLDFVFDSREERIDGKLYLQSHKLLRVSLRGARASAGTRVKLCCLDSSERLLAPQWRVLQLV